MLSSTIIFRAPQPAPVRTWMYRSRAHDAFGRLMKICTLVSGCVGTGAAADGGRPPRLDLPRIAPEVIIASVKEFLELS